MSTHDPKDGLTDVELHQLPLIEWYSPKADAWIRRLARENAALKAEQGNAKVVDQRIRTEFRLGDDED